ncbi:serine/threonine-protein phosphatase 4 regulatory subunit 4-like [Littorina saxatilis]|uniref:serine/threonine-protein phosphatase 4 regulatory subunit 4-like n=1 Tax=Littorina saxatilis TaxID=31220 RepID=UPI0038B5EE10
MDVTDLTDDLQELNLDRPTKPLKSSEELDRLTVDEKLTDIERAVYLLSSGQEVQRISVITALPNLLKENNAECMRRVVPKVREVLYVAQQDMQLAASTAFLQILQDKLVPLQNYAQTFLQTILTSVDSKDPEVAAAWLETLLDVIDLLPTEIIKKDILGIAINKGQLQQPVPVRLSCCKILGKIATKFESFLIKKDILPVVQQLCQDVEHEVRACMCYQLDSVARGLGLEATKSAIITELVELTSDEESNVRIAGLDTVVEILPMLDNDTLVTTIVPLVCKLCQRVIQAEDNTLPVVARQLGPLCHGMQGVLTDEQKHWFLDYYKKLCRYGIPEKVKGPEKGMLCQSFDDSDSLPVETRRSAAYNLPAMVHFVGHKNFKTDLLPTLTHLCRDHYQVVRKTTACGFHEISKLLGPQATILFVDFITLLRDESIEVLQGVVSNLPSALDTVSKSGAGMSDAKLSTVLEVVNAYLSAEAVVFASNCWRLQEDMMRNMSCLGKVCPQDMIYNRVIPILLSKMKNGRALPVRHAACRSVLVLIRCLHKLEQREHLTRLLIQDFCHGRSCRSRGLFIVICQYCIELYSKAYFKEHLFDYILSLTSDPVPNIRMRTCTLLPSLKRLIKLPYDNALKGSLEQCVRKVLVNEKDRDVVMAMKQAVEELDQIHVQMESMVSRRKNFEDDVDDQVKEEEEKQLLELEERERKDDELRASKGEKKLSNAKKDSTKLPAPKKPSLSGSKRELLGTNSKSDIPRRESSSKTSASTSGFASTAAAGSHLNKMKASPTSHRTGNIPEATSLIGAQHRKGSAGNLPSHTAARRGSLGSASSTSSEPSTAGRMVAKSKTSTVTTTTTSNAAPKVLRKISRP